MLMGSEPQRKCEAWRGDYNEEEHSEIGNQTPIVQWRTAPLLLEQTQDRPVP
jgi:hypothetical protein